MFKLECLQFMAWSIFATGTLQLQGCKHRYIYFFHTLATTQEFRNFSCYSWSLLYSFIWPLRYLLSCSMHYKPSLHHRALGRKMERRNVAVSASINEDTVMLYLLVRPFLQWLLAHTAHLLETAETSRITAAFVARLLKTELNKVIKIQKARLDSSVLGMSLLQC